MKTFKFLQPGEVFSRKSACLTCREYRKKCDFTTPCARCIRMGVRCIYTKSTKEDPKDWIEEEVALVERQVTESFNDLWRIQMMAKQAKILDMAIGTRELRPPPSDRVLLASCQEVNDNDVQNKEDLVLTQIPASRSRIQLTFSNFSELQNALQKAIEMANLSWISYSSSPFYKSPEKPIVVVPKQQPMFRYNLQRMPSGHKLDLSGLPDISLNEIPSSMKKIMTEFYFGHCMPFPYYSEEELRSEEISNATEYSQHRNTFLKSVYARAAIYLSIGIMKFRDIDEQEMNYGNLSNALAASVRRSLDFDDISPHTIMTLINLVHFFLSKSEVETTLFYIEHIKRMINVMCMKQRNSLEEAADPITREVHNRMFGWVLCCHVRMAMYSAPDDTLSSEEIFEEVDLSSFRSFIKSSGHNSPDHLFSPFDLFGSVFFVAEIQLSKVLNRITRAVYGTGSVITIVRLLELKGMLDNWAENISDAFNFSHCPDVMRLQYIKLMLDIDYHGSVLFLYHPFLAGSDISINTDETVLVFHQDVFRICLDTAFIMVELVENFTSNYGFVQFYERLFGNFNLTFGVLCYTLEHGDATQREKAKIQIRRCSTLMQNSPYASYENGPASRFANLTKAMARMCQEDNKLTYRDVFF